MDVCIGARPQRVIVEKVYWTDSKALGRLPSDRAITPKALLKGQCLPRGAGNHPTNHQERGAATPNSYQHGHTPALFGREGEQTRLRQLLDAAVGGSGNLVLVGGEAGVGKTALATSIEREAHSRGTRRAVARGAQAEASQTRSLRGECAEAVHLPHARRIGA